MARICFDYGHGGNDPGAVYKGRKEADDNLKLGLAVAKTLRSHGVIVDETRTTDKTMSLSERSSMENKKSYDYFISFHRNAVKPEQANGAETFTYTSQTAKAKGLADKIQRELTKIGFKNRGVKKANFHVLRKTKAAAVLMEVGFIDNTSDNKIFDNNFDAIVEGFTKAILEQLGIKYVENRKPSTSSQTLYRVMAGSYLVRENAERQVERLKKAGFDAAIIIYNK